MPGERRDGYDADQACEDEMQAQKARAAAFKPDVSLAFGKEQIGRAPNKVDPDDPLKVEKLSKLPSAGDDAADVPG